MGSNRAGKAAKLREKRHIREQCCLALKADAAEKAEAGGLVASVKDAAVAAAHKVGDLVKTAAEAVTGAVTKEKKS